jgi:hypothetical protein
MSPSERVVIGMDPHKRSATVEVIASDETILGNGPDRSMYKIAFRCRGSGQQRPLAGSDER